MYIATPVPFTENGRTLSSGEIYTPVKNFPPECPCEKCKDKCKPDICELYMDYEKKLYFYRYTVFD